MKSFIRRAALSGMALAAVCAAPLPANAWSDLGHRVVGDLAYARLTPQARAQVDALIAQSATYGEPSCPVASLADAAAMPDCVEGIRRFNDMRKLHEESEPLCPAQAKGDPCKDGQCTGAATKRALAILADPAAPPDAKLYALEQAAHLIGDLHQPMAMVDNRDDHGRDVRIVLPGSSDKKLNLHDFWDQIVLAPAVGSEELGARWLQPLADGGRGWEQGSVEDWAAETTALGRTIYSRLPEPPPCGRNPKTPETLDRGYVDAQVSVAREQLAKAAVRLAAALNAALR